MKGVKCANLQGKSTFSIFFKKKNFAKNFNFGNNFFLKKSTCKVLSTGNSEKNGQIFFVRSLLLHRAIGNIDIEKLNVLQIIFFPNMKYWAENNNTLLSKAVE